jgi:hypothetical protein
MKKINPFQFWNNGKTVTATLLELHSNFDNLIDSAIFYYSLHSEDGSKLVDGNINMSGTDYSSWTGNNDYAFTWAAAYLGITLI